MISLPVCPRKLAFFLDFSNDVDLFYLILYLFGNILLFHPLLTGLLNLLLTLKFLRVPKLFKPSSGVHVIGATMAASAKDLCALILFLGNGVLIFGTAAYFLESDDGYVFSSIPNALWWALITMTTVGYGDIIPMTTIGKIIGEI